MKGEHCITTRIIDASIGWLLIGIAGFAFYFGATRFVGLIGRTWLKSAAEDQRMREQRQEHLDEIARQELLEAVIED